MHDASYVVTGVGMHTPVGTSAAQTCAALRAGLSRLAVHPHYNAAGEPLSVGVVAADRRCVSWAEKAVPIAAPAIYEALWQARLYAHTWHRRRVGLFFATPPANRTGVAPGFYSHFRASLGALWARLAGNDAIHEFTHAQVGGAIALAHACEALARGTLDAAVVAGFESAVDSAYLDELLRTDRLYTADRGSGIIPGECAAALVLETETAAARREAPARARLVALALEQEPAGWSPRRPSQADALARALQTALAVEPGPAAYHRLIVDHTGERWRFREWVLAEPRVLGGLPRGWTLWHPVESIGDAGAAFVPLALGWATEAFARGYAGSGGILVAASNDAGERAALTLAPVQERRPCPRP